VTDRAAIDVLHELVATPSVSGDERAAVDVFVRHATAIGFDSHADMAGNGIAIRGDPREAAAEIVLLGHVDTVAGEIAVRIEEGVLHGRGSVDAKGPLAAMLIGASRAELPSGVRVRVVAAVGEESSDSPGARALVQAIPAPAACIIGEPSGWDGVTLGYKGRLIVRASVESECGHSAGPAGSPCDALMSWWDGIRTLSDDFNEGRAGAFETVQAGMHAMNSASDGLRDRATAVAGFRLPPWLSPAEFEARIRGRTGANIGLAFNGHAPAHRTDRGDAVVRALSTAIRELGSRPRHKVKTGTADMNLVGPAWGCPIAAYGPGESALDHTPQERLDLDEYERAIAVLTRAVETIAGEVARTTGGTPVPLTDFPRQAGRLLR